MENEIYNIGQNVIDLQIKALKKLKNSMNTSFNQAVRLISKCKSKVIVCGVGKSGIIASKISATLSSVGTPSFSISANDCSHGDLGSITKKDVVILISNSGNSEELKNIIQYVNRNKIKLIGIVSKKNSLLYKTSDIKLLIPEVQEAGFGIVPTTSTSVQLALGDALAISLIEEKNFSSEDFAKSHPAGELGKKLTTYVSDLAISGNKVPCVEIDSSIKDTILEITSKKLGMALVVNNKEVVGIFTDGDLRRALNQEIDIENNSVSSVMTKEFISISENDLAIDAATLMENNKIFTLNVLNQNKQPSVITMHRLLEFGIL